jgi:hypothetical protein
MSEIDNGHDRAAGESHPPKREAKVMPAHLNCFPDDCNWDYPNMRSWREAGKPAGWGNNCECGDRKVWISQITEKRCLKCGNICRSTQHRVHLRCKKCNQSYCL